MELTRYTGYMTITLTSEIQAQWYASALGGSQLSHPKALSSAISILTLVAPKDHTEDLLRILRAIFFGSLQQLDHNMPTVKTL